MVLRHTPLRAEVRDDVARPVVFGELGNFQAGAVTIEEAADDLDATMVDARITAAEA